MSLGNEIWSGVRKKIQLLLSADEPQLRDNPSLRNQSFILQNEVESSYSCENWGLYRFLCF